MAELTGKAVSELPEATSVQDSDLFAVSQNGSSKKMTVATLRQSGRAVLDPYKEWSSDASISAVKNHYGVCVNGWILLNNIEYTSDRPVLVINGAIPNPSIFYCTGNNGEAFRGIARNGRTEIIFHENTTISSQRYVFLNFTYSV